MSLNAVSANLNMATALRIRSEAMDMNVSLSSYVSNLIEEALSARDSKQVIFDDQEALNEYLAEEDSFKKPIEWDDAFDNPDPDIDDSTGCEGVPWESDTDPDFDIKCPEPEVDPPAPDTWIVRWFKRIFFKDPAGKIIGHGTFGEDPEEYFYKKEERSYRKEMEQLRQEIIEIKQRAQHQGRTAEDMVEQTIRTGNKYDMMWGTYGLPPGKLRWVRLVDCSTDHLNNILRSQHQILPRTRRVIKEILKDRRAL